MTRFQKITKNPTALAESVVYPKRNKMTNEIYEWRSPYIKEPFASRREAVKATVIFLYEDCENPGNWNA